MSHENSFAFVRALKEEKLKKADVKGIEVGILEGDGKTVLMCAEAVDCVDEPALPGPWWRITFEAYAEDEVDQKIAQIVHSARCWSGEWSAHPGGGYFLVLLDPLKPSMTKSIMSKLINTNTMKMTTQT